MTTATVNGLHVTVARADLDRALKAAGAGIPAKPDAAILNCVVLETGAGRFTAMGSNRSTAVAASIEAQVNGDGGICVPHAMLYEVVHQLPNEPVELWITSTVVTVDDKTFVRELLNLRCGRYECRFPTSPLSQYPVLTLHDDGDRYEVPADLLKAGIGRTIFAVSDDQARAILTGALWETGDGLTLAAMDGYRLSQQELAVEGAVSHRIVVPAPALKALHILIEDAPVAVTVAPNGKKVRFDTGHSYIVTDVIDGSYPNYSKFLKPGFGTTVTVDRAALTQSVKGAAAILHQPGTVRRMQLAVDPGRLTGQVAVTAAESFTADVDATVEGEPVSIGFEVDLFLDMLRALDNETVTLNFNGATQPMVVDYMEYKHVLMPMMVR